MVVIFFQLPYTIVIDAENCYELIKSNDSFIHRMHPAVTNRAKQEPRVRLYYIVIIQTRVFVVSTK